MARGLDQQGSSRAIPPRRNPFKQEISEIDEVEEQKESRGVEGQDTEEGAASLLEAEVDKEIKEMIDKGLLEDEGAINRNDLRKEIEERKVRERHLKEHVAFLQGKKQQAQEVADKREAYLLSQGLEKLDDSLNWDEAIHGHRGLIEEDYEITVVAVDDDYLKQQGKTHAFSLRESPEVILSRSFSLFKSNRGRIDDPPEIIEASYVEGFFQESSGQNLIAEAYDQFIEDERSLPRMTGLSPVKGLAASAEEARSIAEEARAQEMAKKLSKAREYHAERLEAEREQRRKEDEYQRAAREREEARKASEKKAKDVAQVFAGLEWGHASARSFQEKKLRHLVNRGRDFKRQRMGQCDLVTFYEDQEMYRTIQNHSVGGAIFYDGELRAIIKEDSNGCVEVLPGRFFEYGFQEVGDQKKQVLYRPNRWAARRRDKREKDPEKIRKEVEAAAKGYVEELLAREVLDKIS